VRKGGEKLVISNVEADTYSTQIFDTDPKQVRTLAIMSTFSQRDYSAA
jgi:hypothetical protein